jgi:hypothetical protein
MKQTKKVHLVAKKHVVRYLKGALDYGLSYVTNHEFSLYGYLNLYWGSSIPNHKSTLTYCFSLGSSMVSWRNMKKSCVALSMTEVEYVASCATCGELVWL